MISCIHGQRLINQLTLWILLRGNYQGIRGAPFLQVGQAETTGLDSISRRQVRTMLAVCAVAIQGLLFDWTHSDVSLQNQSESELLYWLFVSRWHSADCLGQYEFMTKCDFHYSLLGYSIQYLKYHWLVGKDNYSTE